MQLTLRLMNELIGSDGEDSRSRIYLSYYGGYTSLIATSLHRLARVFFVFVGAESRVREERGLKVFPIRLQIARREPLHRLSQPSRQSTRCRQPKASNLVESIKYRRSLNALSSTCATVSSGFLPRIPHTSLATDNTVRSSLEPMLYICDVSPACKTTSEARARRRRACTTSSRVRRREWLFFPTRR